MDFGFYLPGYWPDLSYAPERLYGDMLEQAKVAEDLGFVSVTIPEHHFINYLTHPNTLLTAVRVAGITTRIRLITAVLVLPFSDMRRLAGEVAQADCLTNGRLEIGVGRGAFRYEFARFGIPPEESRERFVDALNLLTKLLSETDVSWKSKFYDFPSLTTMPRPVQKPHPPVWVAALAPESIYSSVKFGNHVMTTPLRDPFEAAKSQAAAFFRAVDEEGERAKRLRISTLRMTYVSRNEADIREKRQMAMDNHRRFTNLHETSGEVCGGAVKPLEHVNVTEDELEKALIIGPPDYCLEKVKAYADLGIHNMQLNMTFGANLRDATRSMELFSERIMPHFRDTIGSAGPSTSSAEFARRVVPEQGGTS